MMEQNLFRMQKKKKKIIKSVPILSKTKRKTNQNLKETEILVNEYDLVLIVAGNPIIVRG